MEFLLSASLVTGEVGAVQLEEAVMREQRARQRAKVGPVGPERA